MLPYLVKRLSLVVPTILAVLVITFFLLRASGSPVDEILGEKGGTPEQRRMLERELGLDEPLVVQFVRYFARLFKGDMGTIVSTRTPVAREIARRLPNTVKLAVAAMVLATLVGVASGMLSAVHRNSVFDVVLRTVTFCFISTPVFWFGIMLIFVFAYLLGWLPASATGEGGAAVLVLPVIALGLRPAAFIARVTRSSLLDELSKDYVRTARAKGLSEWRVTTRHVLRNTAIPLITVIGGDLGSLLGGTMITETVFSVGGVGRFAVEAVVNRWYDAVMGVALLWAAVFVVVNLCIDVAYALADPRVAFEKQ
ncbi:MAG TPA: ABC transporter permease [Planctomycetota bacterium]|nr:ABC transporter permease [Planctomycetota bacterium]